MWCVEYARRKQYDAPPKEEWAYIMYVQKFTQEHQDAPRTVIMDGWNTERAKQVAFVHELLKSMLST